MKKINLAIIFGGKSREHEVSLASAISVLNALNKEKYNIIPIAITKKGNWLVGDRGEEYLKLHSKAVGVENGISIDNSQSLVTVNQNNNLTNYLEGTIDKKIDLILPLTHGPFGEDGKLQGMLDMIGVPYLFSGTLAGALAMDKHKTKIIASSAGLDTAPSVKINAFDNYSLDNIVKNLSFPIVIKPVELGSSVGMSIAHDAKELEEGIKNGFKYGQEILLEKFIKGRELTVAVMGNGKNAHALPVIEIIPKISGWFDFKAKYEEGGSDEICPAEIPDEIKNKAQNYALKIYKEIGCKDLARADFIWSGDDDKLYFLEINTIPGMTNTSLTPKAAKVAGMEFSEFLDKLIEGAIK